MRNALSLAFTVGVMTAAAPAAGLAASLLDRLVPNGPVIDVLSDDASQSLAALPDGFGGVDLLATAPIAAFSFDAPFDAIDPLFVDFGLVTDPLEADGFVPGTGFLSVTDGAGEELLFSDDVVAIDFIADPVTPEFAVLFTDLEGSQAGAFTTGFALFTVGDLFAAASVDNPFQSAVVDEEFEVFGVVQGVAVIPLPAAAWMLLAGMGALVAAGRRRG